MTRFILATGFMIAASFAPTPSEQAPPEVFRTSAPGTFVEPSLMEFRLVYMEAAAGRLEVQHDGRTVYLGAAIITDQDIVAVTPDRQAGRLVVDVELTPEAAERLRQCTAANIGAMLAVRVDGHIRSAPTIRGRVPQGTNIQVALEMSDDEADRIAALVRSAWPERTHR